MNANRRHSRFEIILEDEVLLAVNKPAGLLVLPDRFNTSLPNLVALLKKKLERVFVVHRIDRETSGLILFAKTADAHAALNRQFRVQEVEKRYLALVKGTITKTAGEVDLPLAPSKARRGTMLVDHSSGKPSRTEFRVLEQFREYALVEAQPKTGRSHQVRVHLRALGIPLIADEVYGDGQPLFVSAIKKRFKGEEEERPLIERAALHARSITFRHPSTRKMMTLEAEMPKDFRAALQVLRKYAALSPMSKALKNEQE